MCARGGSPRVSMRIITFFQGTGKVSCLFCWVDFDAFVCMPFSLLVGGIYLSCACIVHIYIEEKKTTKTFFFNLLTVTLFSPVRASAVVASSCCSGSTFRPDGLTRQQCPHCHIRYCHQLLRLGSFGLRSFVLLVTRHPYILASPTVREVVFGVVVQAFFVLARIWRFEQRQLRVILHTGGLVYIAERSIYIYIYIQNVSISVRSTLPDINIQLFLWAFPTQVRVKQ